ncbi:MAG TPA: Xaa-Pro peptidase family protein [Rhizobiaceae bacterium]|nr:Xaa-Pro peptidase family protein [Rhizobiaceae bacterium]
MNVATRDATAVAIPFDHDKLDRLMDAAGIDIIVATSKHNVQYMLGGYRFIFFHAMDAIGHSRYMPFALYEKGRPDHAAYVGNRMEGHEQQVKPFWTPATYLAAWGTVDGANLVAEHLKKIGLEKARIGYEPGFLAADAFVALQKALPSATLIDGNTVFERLRAIKTPAEIDLLRQASELITDSMLATFAASREGTTRAEVVETLRREEVNRGLNFEYCLLTFGSSHNRAVSPQAWKKGEVMSIDSGGNFKGYIGDLCRMGVLGEPDAELDDLLSSIEAVQQAAFSKCRPGTLGGDMIAHAEAELKRSAHVKYTDFFAHGMGLISHEAPFLMTNHPVAYEGIDAAHPLEPGHVLSVETTMLHPSRGFIKLEDTVTITKDGHELLGARGRGWNRGG